MKVIFIGTTGVHHALVAANLLVGQGDDGRYSSLRGFADTGIESSGKPFLVSDDGRGNQVYSLGVGKDLGLAERAMGQFINILGFESSDIMVKKVPIKGDKLMLLLIALANIGWLKTISNFLAEKLIKWQLRDIKQCVQQVKI